MKTSNPSRISGTRTGNEYLLHNGYRIRPVFSWSAPNSKAWNIHDYKGDFVEGQFYSKKQAIERALEMGSTGNPWIHKPLYDITLPTTPKPITYKTLVWKQEGTVPFRTCPRCMRGAMTALSYKEGPEEHCLQCGYVPGQRKPTAREIALTDREMMLAQEAMQEDARRTRGERLPVQKKSLSGWEFYKAKAMRDLARLKRTRALNPYGSKLLGKVYMNWDGSAFGRGSGPPPPGMRYATVEEIRRLQYNGVLPPYHAKMRGLPNPLAFGNHDWSMPNPWTASIDTDAYGKRHPDSPTLEWWNVYAPNKRWIATIGARSPERAIRFAKAEVRDWAAAKKHYRTLRNPGRHTSRTLDFVRIGIIP